MDKEALEIITDIADMKGSYEQKCYDYEHLFSTLINSAGIDCSGKNLRIDDGIFTALLSVEFPDDVQIRIDTLKEKRNEDDG